ncbi:MAG TPA: hypothetical protein VNE39_22995 [Planctomycetota bacterium]|nr:hypothetical protein [Planctomycetota bacterium]
MTIQEFLERVEGHPCLDVVHLGETICILRCTEEGVSREIRLGFWAVARCEWEQLLRALSIPAASAVA